MLDQFVRKGVFIGSSSKGLAVSLARFILDKHRLDSSRKFWQSFAGLNNDLLEALPRIPSIEAAGVLVKSIALEIRPKIEKRLLQEMDDIYKVVKCHLVNFYQNLEKSRTAESYSPFDGEWQAINTTITLNSAAEIRDNFTNKLGEVTDLDFPPTLSGSNRRISKKHGLLKFWQSRLKPAMPMNLPYVRAIEDFLAGSVKTLNDSSFAKLGFDFGVNRFVHLSMRQLMRLLSDTVLLVYL